MENTAGPTTFKTPNIQQNAAEISKNPRGWFKRNIVKVAIGVLILAVVGEVVFGAFSLFAPNSSRSLNPLAPKVNEMKGSQLSLVPEKTAYKKGDTVVINVKLFTGGYTTDSTDLVVKYDPQFLKPLGNNFAVPGQIYSEYPPAQADEKKGLIGISGITSPQGQPFSGVGNFAKLSFTALKDGQTQVMVDYQPEQTADSNVVLSGSTKDILNTVDSADINISDTASETSTTSQASMCESFTQHCQDGNGSSGSQVCKAGTMKDGVCGYDSKLTVSCEVCKI